jgi:hypothetical protein
VALNIGENFKQRWLATPESIRHSYCDELRHISALLDPESQLQKWQYQEAVLQQRQRQITEQAYKQLKLQILAEQARLREAQKQARQAALEQALEDKRAEQHAKLAKQEQLDALKQQQQDAYLKQFAEQLQQQSAAIIQQPISKFDVRQVKAFDVRATEPSPVVSRPQPASALPTSAYEELKLRLELEAQQWIEQALAELRSQLLAAAAEEIELQLAQHSSRD